MTGSTITDPIVLFCSLSVLLIICAHELKKKYRIPTSPCLVLMGFLYRFFANSIFPSVGIVEMMDAMNPEVISYAFLPAIIFQAAAFLDWHRFKKDMAQTVPLASTVVLISAILTAICAKYVLVYDYSWGQAFLLGIVVNATDHVAVKSFIKDTSIDGRLENLLKGETLLNLATVLVMFEVTENTMLEDLGFKDIIVQILRLLFGGLALGLAEAFVMGKILKRFINNSKQEINITFVFTYLLYWVCSSSQVQMSGGVAMIVSGLYMSQYGKTFISPEVFKQLHYTWNIFVHNLECLVFIIAGIILGMYFQSNQYLNLSDLGKASALFLLMHLIRGIALIIHYPLLRYFGYGINLKEILVLSFSGLKGVISTALALMVYNIKALDMDYRSTLLFFAIIISTFSIALDTYTSKWLVTRLNLNAISEVEENLLLGVTTAILQQTCELVDTMKNDNNYRLVKWDEVLEIAGPKILLVEVMKKSSIGRNILEKHSKDTTEKLVHLYNSHFHLNKRVYSEELRKRFYSTLKGIYWRSYNKGECFASTVLHLVSSCNKSMDKINHPIRDWDDYQAWIYNSKRIQLYKRFSDWPIVGKLFRRLAYNTIIQAYDIAFTFERGHSKSEDLMDEMEKELEQDTFESIMDESHSQILSCRDFIKEYITDTYPDIIAEVQGKMACFSLLNKQRKMVQRIHKQGLIKDLEYTQLSESINFNLAQLTFMSNPEILTMEAMLRRRFKKTTSEEIRKILPLISEKHFKPESVMFTQGAHVEGAYLIFSGVVHEAGDLVDRELSKGNIVGAFHLLPEFHEVYSTTATTRTVVISAFIPVNVLNNFFIEEIYKESAKQILLFNREKFGLRDASVPHINKVVENSSVLHLYAGSPLNLRRGALVLKGRVKKEKDKFSLLRPCRQIIESFDEAVVMIFPPHFGGILRQHLWLTDAFASYFIRGPTRNVKKKDFDDLKTASTFKINRIETGSE